MRLSDGVRDPGVACGTAMFRRLLKRGSQQPLRLGRWSRTNAERKSELANHDHCGTCKTVFVSSEPYDNQMEISLCALQSLHTYPKRADGVPKTKM